METDNPLPFPNSSVASQNFISIIVTAVCLGVAAISTIVRVYIRLGFRFRRAWWDDGVIVAALFFYFLQSAAVLWEIQQGSSAPVKALTAWELINLEKIIYVDNVFYLASVWLSKVAVACLYLRLSSKQYQVKLIKALVLFLAVTGVTAILLVALLCHSSQPWMMLTLDGNGAIDTCTGAMNHWYAITTLDIATEIGLAIASPFLLCPFQATRSRKSIMAMALNQRLAIIVPIFLHVYFFPQFSVITHQLAADSSVQPFTSMVCKQVQLAFAITSTMIPCLRPFTPSRTMTSNQVLTTIDETKSFISEKPNSNATGSSSSSAGGSTSEADRIYTLYYRPFYQLKIDAQDRQNDIKTPPNSSKPLITSSWAKILSPPTQLYSTTRTTTTTTTSAPVSSGAFLNPGDPRPKMQLGQRIRYTIENRVRAWSRQSDNNDDNNNNNKNSNNKNSTVSSDQVSFESYSEIRMSQIALAV